MGRTPTGKSKSKSTAAPTRDRGAGRTGASTRPVPAGTPPKLLPPWKVLLHNDDVNVIDDLVKSVQMIVHLARADARRRVNEAHRSGVALLTTTHLERAELYQQQFASVNLTVSLEPAGT